MARTKGKSPIPWDDFYKATPGAQSIVDELERQGGFCMKSLLYTVTVTPFSADEGLDGMVHLSIKRNDKKPIRDWRHMQQIKNIACGPEREAVEIYPAESSLVDESNQFHLWCMPTGWFVPFGFAERMVGSPEVAAQVNARQRAWEVIPDDVDAHIHAEWITMRSTVLHATAEGQWVPEQWSPKEDTHG